MATSSSSLLARRWRIAGWVLLTLCAIAAACIYIAAPGGTQATTSYSVVGGQTFADPGATGWQTQQIERLGGQGTLLIARLDDWLGSLWHGRRLALTLWVVGSLLACACRFVAGLVDDSETA